jgi:hypothetical protein
LFLFLLPSSSSGSSAARVSKNSCPHRDSNSDHLVVQPVASLQLNVVKQKHVFFNFISALQKVQKDLKNYNSDNNSKDV